MNGNVYFIKPVGLDGPYKIGFSRFCKTRLEVFSEWSPFKLEIVAIVEADHKQEMKIHNRLSDLRLHKEWFKNDDVIVSGIRKIKMGSSLDDAFSLHGVEAKRTRKNRRNTPPLYGVETQPGDG